MGGANWMGGRMNTAKARSKDTTGRVQKRHFARRALQLAPSSTQPLSGGSKALKEIDLAAAKREKEYYDPSRELLTNDPPRTPTSRRPTRRDMFVRPSSSSSGTGRSEASKVLHALDTIETTVSRADFMQRILKHADLAGTRRGRAATGVDEEIVKGPHTSSSPRPFPMELREDTPASSDDPVIPQSHTNSEKPRRNDAPDWSHLQRATASPSIHAAADTSPPRKPFHPISPLTTRHGDVSHVPPPYPFERPHSPYRASRDNLKELLDTFSTSKTDSKLGEVPDDSDSNYTHYDESLTTHSSKRRLADREHHSDYSTSFKRRRVLSDGRSSPETAVTDQREISSQAFSPRLGTPSSESSRTGTSHNPWTALYLELGLPPPPYVSRPPWCLPDRPEYWLPDSASLDRHLALDLAATTSPEWRRRSDEFETHPYLSETAVDDEPVESIWFPGLDSASTKVPSSPSPPTMHAQPAMNDDMTISSIGSPQVGSDISQYSTPDIHPSEERNLQQLPFISAHKSVDKFEPKKYASWNDDPVSKFLAPVHQIPPVSNATASQDMLDEINTLLGFPSTNGFAGDAYDTAISDIDLDEILEGLNASPAMVLEPPSQSVFGQQPIFAPENQGAEPTKHEDVAPSLTSKPIGMLGLGSIKSEVINGRRIHLGPSLF